MIKIIDLKDLIWYKMFIGFNRNKLVLVWKIKLGIMFILLLIKDSYFFVYFFIYEVYFYF